MKSYRRTFRSFHFITRRYISVFLSLVEQFFDAAKVTFSEHLQNVVTHTYIAKIYIDFQKVFTPLCSRPLRSLKTSLRSLYSLSHCCVTLEVDRLVASLHENVSTFNLEREHFSRTQKLLFIHFLDLTVFEFLIKKE